ncbi:hypothetical protein NEHOM01_1946 [Nematocida homosporus]|uniref:uncharacterized protein n=1 Tax=Nematocida homosporus TaxID=1912981 RepID=UPI00221FC4E2|nr:uncharacterized protein NEHOM01_1946 [Nematocida homosporus]KAI5187120.1 hypothetical protein NEHOM01_1946 [Nematocida homosporus]
MTLPSELAMNIRIIKALGDARTVGPLRHFIISAILKRLKKPNVITGGMFWKFLGIYYGMNEELEVPGREVGFEEFKLPIQME